MSVCALLAACEWMSVDKGSFVAYQVLTGRILCLHRLAMFFGFNTFDPRHSPAVSAHQESYASGFTSSALG